MSQEAESDKVLIENLDPDFCNEVASIPGGENIKRCFACGTCAAGCPVTDINEEYNPRTIIRQILLGMRNEVLSSPLIWFCLVCYRCYARCPQKVNFTDVMRVLRYLAIKGHHVPPDILAETEEIDRYSQMIRRDLMQDSLEGRKALLEELKARINQKKPETG